MFHASCKRRNEPSYFRESCSNNLVGEAANFMRRIPFDRNAITLTPPVTRSLLRGRGFEVMRTDFMFFFPRHLSWLRPIEPHLTWLPLGAQYQILCQKPGKI